MLHLPPSGFFITHYLGHDYDLCLYLTLMINSCSNFNYWEMSVITLKTRYIIWSGHSSSMVGMMWMRKRNLLSFTYCRLSKSTCDLAINRPNENAIKSSMKCGDNWWRLDTKILVLHIRWRDLLAFTLAKWPIWAFTHLISITDQMKISCPMNLTFLLYYDHLVVCTSFCML